MIVQLLPNYKITLANSHPQSNDIA